MAVFDGGRVEEKSHAVKANRWYLFEMARGNEKFIRRQKEVERQKAQAEKRMKRAERKADPTKDGAPGDADVAAIQAALDAGVDPRTLNTGAGEGGDETATDDEGEEGNVSHD